MKVTTLVGAAAAYACITTDDGVYDVRLDPGRSVPKSLRGTAAELREKAARLLRQAETYKKAATHLENA
ncbi:hypothetical protein [Cupriavidus sp. DL-D2]|uniref:hypothetical protein n=1 Tax=Cupriavidus sp. DL-D2 TaxID=3144974 RepID=UPI0032159DC3